MANNINVLANSRQIIHDFGETIPFNGLAFRSFAVDSGNTCTFTFGAAASSLLTTPVTRAWGNCDSIVLEFTFWTASLDVTVRGMIAFPALVDLKFAHGTFEVETRAPDRFSFCATYGDLPGLRLVIKPERL